jgi:hypothetical protein
MSAPANHYGGFVWSKDGRVLAGWSGSAARLWRVADGRSVTLAFVRKGDGVSWVAMDDEGHVDGDEAGMALWRVQSPDGESLPLGPEREGSRRAGLVQSLFDPPTSGQAP